MLQTRYFDSGVTCITEVNSTCKMKAMLDKTVLFLESMDTCPV